MIQRSHWCLNRTRTSLVHREPITLQIRHKALSADHTSIHHSSRTPLRDRSSFLCRHHRPGLHLTATLISLGIPISNQDKGLATLLLRRYPSPKSVRIVVQDAL